MELLRDLFQFLRARRRWWLVPVVLVLLYLGLLLLFGASSALAPFIYTLY
jgi:hypothetical protein